jgi:molybdenum cofactor cytidylyltransferase
MRLAEALRLEPGIAVSITGAGGKSNTIRKLVTELSGDQAVVVTTTTKIKLDQNDLANEHLIAEEAADLSPLLHLLKQGASVLVTGPRSDTEPKWLGLDLETLDYLYLITRSIPATIFIEADGARGRSLKAPAAHEPVLPEWTDLVITIAALDVVGTAYDGDLVHRSELVASLIDLSSEQTISVLNVAQVLAADSGGLKNVPSSAKVIVLLNKAETQERMEWGEQIGKLVLKNEKISAVILASLQGDAVVQRLIGRTAGIILAAGGSTRLGRTKQTLEWRGKSFVEHAVLSALDAGLSPVCAVVGHDAEKVSALISDMPVIIVENPAPDRGQSSSLKIGLEALGEQAQATVVLLADMPRVEPDLIRRMIEIHQVEYHSVIAPYADGKRGNPVLFDRRTYSALSAVEGDQGGRGIFDQFPPHPLDWDASVIEDVDTEDDLEQLRKLE